MPRDSRGNSKKVGPDVTSVTQKPARPTPKSYASQKSTARVLMDMLLEAPRFEREFAEVSGISLKAVQEKLADLMAKPGSPLRCERVPAPARWRTAGSQLGVRYWRTDAGPRAVAAPVAAPVATMKPLQGCGLMGRPIVLRPGSDWALRREPLVTLGGEMEADR